MGSLWAVPDPEREDLLHVPSVPLWPHPGPGPGSLTEHLECRRHLTVLDADSAGGSVAIVINSTTVEDRVGFASDHRGDLGQAGPRQHVP